MVKESAKKPGRSVAAPPRRRAAPDARPAGLRTPVPGQKFVAVKLVLPTWYLRLIDQEAAFMDYKYRGMFLEMLVNRKVGRITNQRSPLAPKVKPPKQEELVDREQYMWHCAPDVKVRLDDLLEANGGIAIKAFVIVATNEWLGFPALQGVG